MIQSFKLFIVSPSFGSSSISSMIQGFILLINISNSCSISISSMIKGFILLITIPSSCSISIFTSTSLSIAVLWRKCRNISTPTCSIIWTISFHKEGMGLLCCPCVPCGIALFEPSLSAAICLLVDDILVWEQGSVLFVWKGSFVVRVQKDHQSACEIEKKAGISAMWQAHGVALESKDLI
ncbi:hypothetical protein GOP47_0003972 [Adiantum capillus-veneris]|uniref:Uncharacterized protein n=1 Tax=Adiantum capillus-veneris TaxID=13818 RepID=A0A9D4V6Q0_ADICA|nr:hypothetical protein GOP47_0003972 [Adiantum capillus-veneris]